MQEKKLSESKDVVISRQHICAWKKHSMKNASQHSDCSLPIVKAAAACHSMKSNDPPQKSPDQETVFSFSGIHVEKFCSLSSVKMQDGISASTRAAGDPHGYDWGSPTPAKVRRRSARQTGKPLQNTSLSNSLCS